MTDTITKFAKENNFDNAEYIGEYKNLKIYEPYFENKEESYIGLPHFITEDKDGKLNMLYKKEDVFPIYDFFYPSKD